MTDLAINEQKKSLLPAVVAYSLMLVLFCILCKLSSSEISFSFFGRSVFYFEQII